MTELRQLACPVVRGGSWPRLHPPAKRTLAILSSTNVRVAAAICSLSRFSSAALSRTTEHQHRAALSGSIPHDNNHCDATAQHRFELLPISHRPRCRSAIRSIPASNPAACRPIQPLFRLSGEPATEVNVRHSSDHGTLCLPEHTLQPNQIPIVGRGYLAKQTAGSFFGGFRTPARVPAARLAWPASGTLHRS